MGSKHNVWMTLTLGMPIAEMAKKVARFCEGFNDRHIASHAKKAVEVQGSVQLVKLDSDCHKWAGPEDFRKFLDSQGLRELTSYEMLCLFHQWAVLAESFMIINEASSHAQWYGFVAATVDFICEDELPPEDGQFNAIRPVGFICAVK